MLRAHADPVEAATPPQSRQSLVPISPTNGNVQRVRQGEGSVAVRDDAISQSLLQFPPKVVAQRAHLLHRPKIERQFASLAETDRKQGAFRSRPPTAFVSGAVNQRFEPNSTAHKQSANCAQAFQKPARFNDRRMLDPGRDDVVTLIAESEEHALQRKVVGLTAAARENNLIVVAAEQSRHSAPRRLKGSPCNRRGPVPARWIAVVVLEKRTHCSGDRWIDRRAGIVVEIDASHWLEH